MIFGTAFPVLYYAMACDQIMSKYPITTIPRILFSHRYFFFIVYRYIYTAVLGAACLACFIVTLMPKFDKAEYIAVRGVMFILLGLSTASMFVMF